MNLETLQNYCRSLPGTTEDMKWGKNLVFSVGLKMYALISLDDEPGPRLSFKATPEDMAMLTQNDAIIPAPYLARHNWVTFLHLDVFSEADTQRWIDRSYELVFAKLSKKLRQQLRPD